MATFLSPITDGKPLEIIDFKMDLLSSPPEVKEEIITSSNNLFITENNSDAIIYNNYAPVEEGHLDIYLCKFKTGIFRLHILGKIKGQEFRIEKVLNNSSFNCKSISNERIKYILLTSRNILRKYYLSANLTGIENHLQAFLISS